MQKLQIKGTFWSQERAVPHHVKSSFTRIQKDSVLEEELEIDLEIENA